MSTQAVVRTQLLTQTQVSRLEEVAKGIHAAEGEVVDGLRMCASKAVAIGKWLLEAKKILVHGDFTGWCEKETGYDERRCRQFMQAAKTAQECRFVDSEPVYKLLKAGTKKENSNGSDKPKASNFGIRLPLTRDQRRAYNKSAGQAVETFTPASEALAEWITGILDKEIERRSP